MENSNRVIKFRAWDKKRKEIVHFDLDLCNDESRQWYLEQIKDNDLMQYTGLKDKNGVEIFEGDVVEGCFSFDDFDTKMTGIVFWDYDGWSYKNIQNLCDKKRIGMVNYFHNIHNTEKHVHFNEKKVIGNIYENPELLEDHD